MFSSKVYKKLDQLHNEQVILGFMLNLGLSKTGYFHVNLHKASKFRNDMCFTTLSSSISSACIFIIWDDNKKFFNFLLWWH